MLGEEDHTTMKRRRHTPEQVIRKLAEGDKLLGEKGMENLVLDHYLEVLAITPGALLGATALARARATKAFTEHHERLWTAARRRLGDREGTRALIDVLLLHRTMETEAVLAGIDAALRAGSTDPQVVAIEGRRGTLWDGFQTLPTPSKPLQENGSQPPRRRSGTAPGVDDAPPAGPDRPVRRKRDSFQTPHGDPAAAAPTATTPPVGVDTAGPRR